LTADSEERWEQYAAATEGRELALDAAPAHRATGNTAAFEQYSAAIEWAEQGGRVPQALTVNYGQDNLVSITPSAGHGWDGEESFKQYMAAVEGRELTLDTAAARTVTSGGGRSAQYPSAADSTGRVRTFAPGAPTGEHDLQLYAEYQALIANKGRGPTFASEADWGAPK
jgi:hypothetical protein